MKRLHNSQTSTENVNLFINRQKNSFILRRELLITKFPKLKAVFFGLDIIEAKYYYKMYNKYILLLDVFCFVSDLIIVTWLYFNHFEYNSHGYRNNYCDNIQKLMCMMLSGLVIVSIILRYVYKQKMNNIKYILSLKGTIPSQHIKFKPMLYEIIIHCLQPYPNVNVNFGSVILGIYVTYSLDMILFALSLLRLYVVLKVIKYWNTYTNSRGQKIFEFFGNQRIWLFLYRTNLKINSFVTLVTIFILFLMLSAYLFKVFENYQILEANSPFGNIWNCFWFILQTMTTVGLGDYIPETLIARFMAVFVSVVGLLLQSLLMISITLFISISDENQGKAYAEINLLYTKGHNHNSYKIYFDNYIKYKFRKMIPKRTNDELCILSEDNCKKDQEKLISLIPNENKFTVNNGNNLNNTNNKLLLPVNPSIKMNNYVKKQEYIDSIDNNKANQSRLSKNRSHLNQHKVKFTNIVDLFNKMKVIKEKHFLRLLSSLQIPITISDFCDFAKNQWEPQMEDIVEWYRERNDTFKSFIDFINENIQSYQQEIFTCLKKTTQMINLILFIYLCGPIFTIEPIKQLRGDRIIKIKQVETKIREFHVKHYLKRRNSLFYIENNEKDNKPKENKFPILVIDDYVTSNVPLKSIEETGIIDPDNESSDSENSKIEEDFINE